MSLLCENFPSFMIQFNLVCFHVLRSYKCMNHQVCIRFQPYSLKYMLLILGKLDLILFCWSNLWILVGEI